MISTVLNKHVKAKPEFTAGGEKRLVEILRHMIRLGHDVTVLTTKDSGLALKGEKLGVKTVILGSFAGKLEIGNIGVILDYLHRLLCVFRERKRLKDDFDAIVTATALLPDALACLLFLARYRKVKCVIHLHHIFDFTYPDIKAGFLKKTRVFLFSSLSGLQQLLVIKIIKRYKIVVFALPMTAIMLSKTLHSEFIRQVENGVNLKLAGEARPVNNFEGIYIGRLSAKKGAYDLIDIWRHICDKYEHAKLAIVGSIEDPLVLKEIKTHGLELNISFYGVVSETKKFELLKSSKVFLFPSHEEGWGIAVSEALACEIPVVAYDLPAYSYAGNSIMKVRKGNTVAFASKVIQLLSDEKARKDLSTGTHKNVKDWSEVARDEIAMMTKELVVG